MESLEILYEQYYNLIEKIQENTSNELRIDILQYGITKVYYENIDKATGLLQNFYDKYLMIEKLEILFVRDYLTIILKMSNFVF